MKLQFIALNEQGKRENNEDNYYPQSDSKEIAKNLYMVCDGVGGADKGEVASNIACSAIAEYFKSNKGDEVNDSFVQSAVMQAELGMRKYIELNPDSKGMATTLTLLYFDKEQAVVAHCGDSRVYQVRNGEILHKTYDHSLVNELLASGFIKTEEEAANHPKKNVITRALSGGKEHTEADVTIISNVEKDDFFLLCSDGILESVDDATICRLFVKKNTPEFIRNEIKKLCDVKSNDNFTAIIAKTEQGFAASKTPKSTVATALIVADKQEVAPVPIEIEKPEEDVIIIKEEVQENYEKKSNKPIKFIMLLGLLAILVYAGWKYILPALKSDKKENRDIQHKTTPHQRERSYRINPNEKEDDKKQNKHINKVEKNAVNAPATMIVAGVNKSTEVTNNKKNSITKKPEVIAESTTKTDKKTKEKVTTLAVNPIEKLSKEIAEIESQLKDTTLDSKKRTMLSTSLANKRVDLNNSSVKNN